MSVIHDQVFGARTPNYKVLQQLDRKVRDFYTPPSLQVPGFGGPMTDVDSVPVYVTLQRYIGFAIREMTLFYMHRGFFARAIEDCPDDPLGSKYAPSVLAVYNSACSFVGLIKSLFSQQPILTERMWFLFTHVFLLRDRVGFYTNQVSENGACSFCPVTSGFCATALRGRVAEC